MSAPVLSRLFIAIGKGLRQLLAFQRGARRVRSVSRSPNQHPRFIPGTPTPNPQSQSFSRGYGSNLPTSLIYIVLSTRGCSPWRPDAVMSTTRGENHVSPGFSRAVERAQDTTNMQCFPSGRSLSPAKLIPGKNAVK